MGKQSRENSYNDPIVHSRPIIPLNTAQHASTVRRLSLCRSYRSLSSCTHPEYLFRSSAKQFAERDRIGPTRARITGARNVKVSISFSSSSSSSISSSLNGSARVIDRFGDIVPLLIRTYVSLRGERETRTPARTREDDDYLSRAHLSLAPAVAPQRDRRSRNLYGRNNISIALA